MAKLGQERDDVKLTQAGETQELRLFAAHNTTLGVLLQGQPAEAHLTHESVATDKVHFDVGARPCQRIQLAPHRPSALHRLRAIRQRHQHLEAHSRRSPTPIGCPLDDPASAVSPFVKRAPTFIFNLVSRPQNTWLADHAMQRERGSATDIGTGRYLSGIEVTVIKTNTKGSDFIQRTRCGGRRTTRSTQADKAFSKVLGSAWRYVYGSLSMRAVWFKLKWASATTCHCQR